MTRLHVCARSRWDALELMDSLLPYHAYLVQKGPAEWDVIGYADLDAAPVDELANRIRVALRKRSLEQAEVTFDDGRALVVAA
jgi:hypothetical protein